MFYLEGWKESLSKKYEEVIQKYSLFLEDIGIPQELYSHDGIKDTVMFWLPPPLCWRSHIEFLFNWIVCFFFLKPSGNSYWLNRPSSCFCIEILCDVFRYSHTWLTGNDLSESCVQRAQTYSPRLHNIYFKECHSLAIFYSTLYICITFCWRHSSVSSLHILASKKTHAHTHAQICLSLLHVSISKTLLKLHQCSSVKWN